ncbi:MAG: FtsX-like permease family protein [Gemmatimonadaceae bacterium]|nr:FtsX-like permease family protein [Gemmatimonadaceae bacterium]
MRFLRPLDRKAIRDVWHLRGPALAIAVVVLCGVASFVSMRSMVPHLTNAQQAYYRDSRFADLWVNVKRAPVSVLREIAAMPGVTAVEVRVSGEVILDVPGLPEPATGLIVGLPTSRVPALDLITIRRGRALATGHDDDVVISEGFANANALAPGDSLGAVVNGRWRQLHIVGTALSPEFVLEMRPTDLFPDNQRYGIVWIAEDAARAAFGMQGAWNQAAIALAKGASASEVIARLDVLLARYGTLGAYGRSLQMSHRFLSDEIKQARAMATAAPAIFLGVAAFLLNIVLSRIVASQREQIGMLKAFGLTAWELARHYALIALGPVLAGALSGSVLGLWLAGQMAGLYARYYRIPNAPFQPHLSVIVIGVGISVLAALFGAVSAVRRVLRLPAADAMRPEAPARYRAGLAESMHLDRWLSPVGRMTLRAIERRPLRAALGVLGMALGVAVMMVGAFQFDAIRTLRDVQFEYAQREDIAVTFTGPRGENALRELSHLPGVTRVEATRAAAVRVQHEQHTRQLGLVAVDGGARLRPVVDAHGRRVELPGDGLLISRSLATLLDVHVGDTVRVEALTGRRHAAPMRIGALLNDLVGTNAYLPTDELRRFVGEGDVLDGAVMSVEAEWQDTAYARLKRFPGVAGVGARAAVVANFDKMMADSFNVTLFTLLLFAGALAVGVVYNTARIALSERGRELASLRVLGFTRSEVARMLFGEQLALGFAAVPVGYLIGAMFCWLLVSGFSSELFRLPFVIHPRTFLSSALLLVVAGLGSAVLVRRRLDQLDLVAVLKTRE